MSIVDDIQKLQTLHENGTLSPDEFNQAKSRLLNGEKNKSCTQSGSLSPIAFIHTLGRSRKDAMFGGVCGGLALSTSLPAWAWRLLFAVTTLSSFGVVGILYVLLWMLMPYSNTGDHHTPQSPTANT